MSMSSIFSLTNLLVMPFWFLMIVLPKWSVTRRLMESPWVAAPVAIIYSALVLPQMGSLLPLLSNPSVSGISEGLGTAEGATVAWAHFLAFDLFVGRWSYLDSRERGISALLMAPVLFFTLMFGPFGLMLYLILRAVRGGDSAETPA